MTEFGGEETIGDLDTVVSAIVFTSFIPDTTTASADGVEGELHVVETIDHGSAGGVEQAALEVEGGGGGGEGVSDCCEHSKTDQQRADHG